MRTNRYILRVMATAGIALLFFSCTKDKGPEPAPVSDPPPPEVIADFPNKTGYEWTYAVYDSISVTMDTVKVVVGGPATMKDGRPATIWQINRYKGSVITKTDTNFVYRNGDTAIVYYAHPFIYGQDQQTRLLFPLSAGKAWPWEKSYLDSSRVISEGPYTVNAGTFSNCSQVFTKIFEPNYRYYNHSWFVPKVGLVRLSIYDADFGPMRYETWILLSYKF